MGFLANIQQFDLLGLFAANGGLRAAGAFQRKARRFLNIFAQCMAIQGNHQRDGIRMDQLNAIFVINILFPERRQMHLDGVEIVAPFIGIVGVNAVAGDRARHAEHSIALRVQRQGDGRGAGAGRAWRLQDTVQRIEVIFNRAALFRCEFARGGSGKGV
ncbi:hypothetical protein D3C81_1396370 [compost metagenome]